MFRLLVKTLLKLVFRVRVEGDARPLNDERVLVVANHESFLDGLLLAVFMPVNTTFVVHTQVLRNALFRWMLSHIRHLAVDPTSPLAIRTALRAVEAGDRVVIFPEGRITNTGSLMKVYDGGAFVAAKSGATVVPVRIHGAGQSYFSRLAGVYPRRLFPRITLSIQPAVRIPMPAEGSSKERRRKAGEAMRDVLLEMLVATRPRKALYRAFLDSVATFGRGYPLLQDINLTEERYGSMVRMSVGLGRLLARRSSPGEAVGVLLPNAVATLGVVLGLWRKGRLPAMLNYTAGAEGMRAACTAALVKRLVTSRAFVEKAKLTDTLAKLEGLEIIYLEDLRATLSALDKLAILILARFPTLGMHPSQPRDPAVILFTSGSEGKPKGVVHSHNSIFANIVQVRAVSDFMPSDRFLVALPLFHSFGFTCGAMLPLIAGCKSFLYPSPLHYRIIPELVYDRNCTVLFGTNTFLANYGKYAHPYDFGRLRYVVAGAEKLREEVRQMWVDKFGLRILEGYGVTECAPVIAVNVPQANRRGTVGRLLPGMRSRLEPVEGIASGGRLAVTGPNLMLGYLRYERPGVLEAPKHAQDTGWYDTGDIVAFDPDGFISIQGRAKRFAKLGGEMVSLEVVEQLAARTAPETQHAVVSRADASKGEALVLYTTAPELKREALLATARAAGLPELAVPRDIRRLDKLPLLGTGKVDYVSLKALLDAS
jgi:acyl-[acyl-carrier-protein]-phospholipid O-acyltransferase/long-chain-fatty-acid--[acyl-carrier-protein] ligase